jgi:predicted transcriptional regulator
MPDNTMAIFKYKLDYCMCDSGMPEIIDKQAVILEIVKEYWPISALEIAEHFKENTKSRKEKRKASTKYSYYLKKLIEKHSILSKRVGNSLIVWPIEVEKYRTIHQILKEGKHAE